MDNRKRNRMLLWGFCCVICILLALWGYLTVSSSLPAQADYFTTYGTQFCDTYSELDPARTTCIDQAQQKFNANYETTDNEGLIGLWGGGIGTVIFGILFLVAYATWARQYRLAQGATGTPGQPLNLSSSPSNFSPQTVSAAPAAPSQAQTSLEAELQKLTDMKQRGVIDEDEYKRLRANVINRT